MNSSKLPPEFSFKKKFGQNFITDKNLLRAIVADAGITNETCVLEIGAGAGTLTEALSAIAKRVVAVEVDKTLISFLQDKFKNTNVEIVNADILKLDDAEIKGMLNGPFSVVANLPYYITTPIIFKFVNGGFNLESLTVMVQKELAERLNAKAGTKAYGGITVTLDCKGDVKYLRTVPRTVFTPPPNVDSALIKWTPNKNKFKIKNPELLEKVIKTAFSMRRKTLSNNLCSGFDLDRIKVNKVIESCGFKDNIRGEMLTTIKFIELSNKLEEELCR